MLIMVDTNVLFSAYVYPSAAMERLISTMVNVGSIAIPLYVLEEFIGVVSRKFPDLLESSSDFIDHLVDVVLEHPEPLELQQLNELRDPKDRPILLSAYYYGVDCLVTGDKDFHQLALKGLEILTPVQFAEKYAQSG